jgi:hypothetical protein
MATIPSPPLIPGSSKLTDEFVTKLKVVDLTAENVIIGDDVTVGGDLTVTGTIQGLTLTDGTFSTTGGVVTSATVVSNTNNVAANSLKTTGAVVNVAASAPPASSYVLIATSATTATWQAQTALTGVPAPAGLGFAMFYGLTAGTGNGGASDYAGTVAVKTSAGTGRVPFPRLGSVSLTNGPTLLGDNASVNLPSIGTYMVSFSVHTTEPGQLQLELGGTALAYTCSANMNPTSGGHPIGGTFFVTTVANNSVLAVINPAGNAAALTITPADGSETHANTQSLVVTRIA